MEGLRLLDESQREGGPEPAQDAPSATVSASASPAADISAPTSGAASRGSREEEEDVLLDN